MKRLRDDNKQRAVSKNPYKFPYKHGKMFSNRPITKFYNGNDVNVIASLKRLTKTRLTSFYEKQFFLRNNANRCK